MFYLQERYEYISIYNKGRIKIESVGLYCMNISISRRFFVFIFPVFPIRYFLDTSVIREIL